MNKRELLKILREINVCGYEIGPDLIIWVHRGPYEAVEIDPKTVDRTKAFWLGKSVYDANVVDVFDKIAGLHALFKNDKYYEARDNAVKRLRSQLGELNKLHYARIKRARIRQDVELVKNFIYDHAFTPKTRLKLAETVYKEMQIESIMDQ